VMRRVVAEWAWRVGKRRRVARRSPLARMSSMSRPSGGDLRRETTSVIRLGVVAGWSLAEVSLTVVSG